MIGAVWSAKDGTYGTPPGFVLNVDVGPILPGIATTTMGGEVVLNVDVGPILPGVARTTMGGEVVLNVDVGPILPGVARTTMGGEVVLNVDVGPILPGVARTTMADEVVLNIGPILSNMPKLRNGSKRGIRTRGLSIASPAFYCCATPRSTR